MFQEQRQPAPHGLSPDLRPPGGEVVIAEAAVVERTACGAVVRGRELDRQPQVLVGDALDWVAVRQATEPARLGELARHSASITARLGVIPSVRAAPRAAP